MTLPLAEWERPKRKYRLVIFKIKSPKISWGVSVSSLTDKRSLIYQIVNYNSKGFE